MAAGGQELTFASACAVLEKRGVHRDKIRHLTPGYVNRVIGHPRDEKGNLLLPEPPAPAGEGLDDRVRRRLRVQGCPEHMVELRLAELRSFRRR